RPGQPRPGQPRPGQPRPGRPRRGRPPGGPGGRARRWTQSVGVEARGQQPLALLGALDALVLRLAEQLRRLLVARSLRVLDVVLEAQGVAQARLGEPDDVVVLVHRAGDVTGLRHAHAILLGRPCPPRVPATPGTKRSDRRTG